MNYIYTLTNEIAFGWLDLEINNVDCWQFLEIVKVISGYLFGSFVCHTAHNLFSLFTFCLTFTWCCTLTFSVPGCQFIQYYIFCLYLVLASVKENPLIS